LDDDYFRGGDVLHYFWLATDAGGGTSSLPAGLTAVPTSIVAAHDATQGLFEVSFLPMINWGPGYAERVMADPHGKLDPTPDETAASSQGNCVLYVQQVNPRRRAGDLHRTSFMYALDVDLMKGDYDVYDHQGLGDTNNHLAGRASLEQATGYSLIIYDAGNRDPDGTIMPDGSDAGAQKLDQAGWFQAWLDRASTGAFGWATLWVTGSNALQERRTNSLYVHDMGTVLNNADQSVSTGEVNPDVAGQTSFDFVRGGEQATVDFTSGTSAVFALEGGCPDVRDYDGMGTSGTGVATHRYRHWLPEQLGDAAIVMNSSPAAGWNTIMQSHAWSDIRPNRDASPQSPTPGRDLVRMVVNAVTPYACSQIDSGITDVDENHWVPHTTRLYPNSPNPFNPATSLRFDLANPGFVHLRIVDVAGRVVRTLVREARPAGRYVEVWNGLNEHGQRVSSGVYFYRLDAPGFTETHKLVLLR